MNSLHKSIKLSTVQLFTFKQAVYIRTSSLILFRHRRKTHVKITWQWKSNLRENLCRPTFEKFPDKTGRNIKHWQKTTSSFQVLHFKCLRFLEGKKSHDYQDPYDYEEDYNSDDDDDDEDKCPTIDLPLSLGGKCDVSDFCSKITCEARVQGKSATIIFQVNRCDDPLTATVTIKSPGFAVDWSHTFKDGDVIKLPMDHVIPGELSEIAAFSSISLKVGLKKQGEKLHFKVFFPQFFGLLSNF